MSTNTSTVERVSWKATSTAVGALGGLVVRQIVGKVFASMSNSDAEPPLNPADRRVSWTDALGWTITAGIGAGVGRLVSQRVAATAWEAATGSTPPGVID